MNQFNHDPLWGTRHQAAALPETPRLSDVIHDPYVTMRFSVARIDGRDIVTRLHVEATHPKVSGQSRVFDLSHILEEGYRRHPSTVSQIVDPNLSLESRLDALKTVALTFARVNERLAPTRDVEYGSKRSRSVDGLEPTFSIKSVVLTEFSDLLRGFSRRGVTVIRNEEPWVQFFITDTRETLRSASIVLLPSGLEFPLLDREGFPVTEKTLNASIHDFTHILHQGRYAPELKVLQRLAGEITERLSRNPNSPRALAQRNFVLEVFFAAKDGVLWSKDPSPVRGHRGAGLAPSEFQARELPDGRVLWMRHRKRTSSSEITLIADSLEGTRYELTFHYPPQTHTCVAHLLAKAVGGARWPLFNEMTDFLHAVPRSGFGVKFPKSADTYPSAVNAFIREIADVNSANRVERGLFRDDFNRFDFHLPQIMSDFVKGRSPFFAVIDNSDPSESWLVQGFLDRDLKGTLYAVNGLGGSIVAQDPGFAGTLEGRRERLLTFFKLLGENSAQLTRNPNFTSGLSEARRNLPDRSWEDALGYAALVHGVSLAWNALVKEDVVSPQHSASQMRWDARKVREGVWSVSLVTGRSRGSWVPSLISITASRYGVAEICYSWGLRGPLGGLWGKRIRVQSGGGFSDEEVFQAVRVILQGAKGTLGMSERGALSNVAPSATITGLSSLRDVDPDGDKRDLLKRLWRFLKAMW